jgi:hypothetical protein
VVGIVAVVGVVVVGLIAFVVTFGGQVVVVVDESV